VLQPATPTTVISLPNTGAGPVAATAGAWLPLATMAMALAFAGIGIRRTRQQ
jgi:hypothetical protein